MFDLVLSDPRARERYNRTPFASEIQEYLEWMKSEGYARQTMFKRFLDAVAFCRFLQKRKINTLMQSEKFAPPFVWSRVRKAIRRNRTREPERLSAEIESSLRQFLRFLERIGRIAHFSRSVPELKPPFQAALCGFNDFLRNGRSLAEETLKGYVCYVRRFLSYIESLGFYDLSLLSRESIHSYLNTQSLTVGRRGMNVVCCALRGFVRYLQMEGHLSAPHLEDFPKPRIYRHEDIPRFIRADKVEDMLGSVDRATTQGIRDYAILVLLVTYGLRASEVSRLTLEDIDWVNERIHVRCRKSGRSDIFPLSHPAGEVLLEYLQKARPKTLSRQIFLTLHAPLRPFRTGAPVSSIARKYLLLAGVCFSHMGAHVLRHTCAHELLNEGFSYKTIGDYLGHSSVSSTSVYLKVDLDGLREVVLSDGEDLL